MPQLPKGQLWPYMSSDEILVQMHERFMFAQQFMNTLPRSDFNYKSGSEQIVKIPRLTEPLIVESFDDLTLYAIPRSTIVQLETNELSDLQRYYMSPRALNKSINIGNQTCEHNAHSPYLRCAMNTCGPCEGCSDYQPGVGGAGGAL